MDDRYIAIPEIGAVSYKEFVEKLWKPLPYIQQLNHAALGVAGESGELVDAIKKYTIYEKDLDIKNVKEEIGDLLFYLQAFCNILHIPVIEILQENAFKLAKRYPKGEYSNEAAIARADKVGESNG